MKEAKEKRNRSELQEKVQEKEGKYKELGENLDQLAVDLELVQEIVEQLSDAGTLEGVEAVEGKLDEAGQAVTEHFEEKDQELEEHQKEGTEMHQDLEEQVQEKEGDLGRLNEANGKIQFEQAIAKLKEAADAASEDKEFLASQSESLKTATQTSEETQQEHRQRIQANQRRT